MTSSVTLRQTVANINKMRFRAKHMAWLKAVCIEDLTKKWRSHTEMMRPVIERFRQRPIDLENHRELVNYFFQDWIGTETPEDNSVFGLDCAKFASITRADAIAAFESLAVTSQRGLRY